MKKITQSPPIFITLALVSLVIVFGAFFYLKTSFLNTRTTYQEEKAQRLLSLFAVHDSVDPLISQASVSQKELTKPIIRVVDPKRGEGKAKITIVEFSDFTCGYCAEVQNILKQLERTYPNQIRIVWKDFPLTTVNPETLKATRAAHCSRLQEDVGDMFWSYHNLLFANQNQLNYDNYLKWAKEVELNDRVFADCLRANEAVNEVINQSMEEGNQLGISGVPYFYVNNQPLSGKVTLEDFKKIIDQELAK